MYGPLDYIALSFPGNEFKGEILPALAEIVTQGTVRIIDLAFIYKDEAGEVTYRELEQLDSTFLLVLDPMVSERTGLLSQGDLEAIASLLDNNSSAALILWESTFATKFAQAVLNANGQVLARETIPYELVNEALNKNAAAASGE